METHCQKPPFKVQHTLIMMVRPFQSSPEKWLHRGDETPSTIYVIIYIIIIIIMIITIIIITIITIIIIIVIVIIIIIIIYIYMYGGFLEWMA